MTNCNNDHCSHNHDSPTTDSSPTKSEVKTRGMTTRREALQKGALATVAAAFPTFTIGSVFAQDVGADIPAIGWAALAKDKPLERFEFTRRALGSKDVLVDILYCGICHSDIHSARDNLNIPFPSAFPVVPGHEIIGRVRQLGRSATRHKVGDIVGVGPYINSDGSVAGQEQYSNATLTYGVPDANGDLLQGGYANNIVADENHVLTIPKGADLARTAPLLCAGITTYSPLKQWEIGEGSRVGVVGLGGLGHMGLKYAVDRGADVTVFTTSPEKKKDALRMGAKEVVVWPLEQGQVYQRANSLDFILSTVPYSFDMDSFMIMLRTGGVMANVGLLEKSNPNYLFVNFKQINLTGSLTGNLKDMQSVIDTSHSNKNLLSEVEVIPVSQINNAIDSVMNKKARYRYVIDMSTLT